MLSIRKKIAVSASLLMATAGVVGVGADRRPGDASSPASARQKAAVTVSIVPGIIGPGGGLQSSTKAKWAVIGKYGANKEGKKVNLQRQSGSSWVTADKAEIDKKGSVIFAVPSRVAASPVTYRVDGPGPPARRSAPTAGAPTSTSSTSSAAPSSNLADWQHRQQLLRARVQARVLQGRPQGRQGRPRAPPS